MASTPSGYTMPQLDAVRGLVLIVYRKHGVSLAWLQNIRTAQRICSMYLTRRLQHGNFVLARTATAV